MRDRKVLLFERREDIIREYERGFVGVFKDAAADTRLRQHIEDIGGYADGGLACQAAGFDGAGAGNIS